MSYHKPQICAASIDVNLVEVTQADRHLFLNRLNDKAQLPGAEGVGIVVQGILHQLVARKRRDTLGITPYRHIVLDVEHHRHILRLEGTQPHLAVADSPVFLSVHECMVSENGILFISERPKVSESVYSSSPPTLTPRASIVTLTGRCCNLRYM